jgi:hypothetical protein
MPVVKKKVAGPATIRPIRMKNVGVNIVGYNMLMHRFSFKAWQELLLPSRRKNVAERNETLKHDPIEEYRSSLYRNRDPEAPTLFHLPNGIITKAMAQAAIDIPGATRASIERLVSCTNETLFLYGTPRLRMDMVRNSDINKTPDVRTRPFFERFAVPGVIIHFKADPLTDQQILHLLAASGNITGFGDWRPEKGGTGGKFRLANDDDPELKAILKEGRAVQQQAYDTPVYHDENTAELMGWYNEEVMRREHEPAVTRKAKGNAEAEMEVAE